MTPDIIKIFTDNSLVSQPGLTFSLAGSSLHLRDYFNWAHEITVVFIFLNICPCCLSFLVLPCLEGEISLENIDPLCQALHMSFLAGKRHFLPLRYCLHYHGQAAVSSNSWQESSKVPSTTQTHCPGVHPSRLQQGHVAPAEKAPKGSLPPFTTICFNPTEKPTALLR